MALGITVTGDALLGYVITLTDADNGDRIRVIRRDTLGYYPDAAVREVDMGSPTGATIIVTDYEASFNVEYHFIAESYLISDLETPFETATSDPIDTALPEGFAIITDALDAGSRVAVGVEELSDWDYKTRILGRHQVLQRNNPVVITDVESGRSGSMIVSNLEQFGVFWDEAGPYLPYTVVSHANWRTVFRSGATLLFRNTYYESGFDDMYFKLESRRVNRLGAVGSQGRSPWLRQTLNYEEVDRPATNLNGLAIGNWEDVFENNANWTEVDSDHADWASVLLDPNL